MTKPKLLIAGDFGCATGFARVVESLIPYWSDRYEIIVFGVNYEGNPHHLDGIVRAYPATSIEYRRGDYWGRTKFPQVVRAERPDILWLFNDPQIILGWWNAVQHLQQDIGFKVVGYTPIDGTGNSRSTIEALQQLDVLATYTEYGAVELRKAGYQREIPIIPHGVNTDDFYPIDRYDARAELGLPQDVFFVFNGNRNQPRKRYGTTIGAFLLAAAKQPKLRLYCHCGVKDEGIHLENAWVMLNQVYSDKYGIPKLEVKDYLWMTAANHSPENAVPISRLNLIYNAMDVGINTCSGEGWGLVNVEHAVCGVPQIVPNHTSTGELFADGRGLLVEPAYWDVFDGDLYRGVCRAEDVAHKILFAYEHQEATRVIADKAREYFTQPKFSWPAIAEQFSTIFSELLAPQQAVA